MGQANFHAPIQQAGVEQVQVRAVILDIAYGFTDGKLCQLLGVIIDILHVALVHPEYPEADVKVSIRMLGFDFVTRPADALFADFANVFVTSFECFGLLVARFRKLYHDELSVSAVLGIELHDSMGGGGRAGKEIEDY